MTKAELWLKESMTVRRWLVVMGAVAVLATVAAYGAVTALHGEEAPAGEDLTPVATGEQRPTSLSISTNVGSVGVLDGRATVSLEVFPTRMPIGYTITVRTAPGTGLNGGTIRELTLKDGDSKKFVAALDEMVHAPDPDNDLTVGDGAITIHAVANGTGGYKFDVKCLGTLHFDADGAGDLKRMIDRAEAQRAWLIPRTAPLRGTTPVAPSVPEIRSASAVK